MNKELEKKKEELRILEAQFSQKVTKELRIQIVLKKQEIKQITNET